MAHPTAVILVVGLNRTLLQHAPRLRAFAESGVVRGVQPVLPAVTCSVQASITTGLPPSAHGIVGNGWYNRELAEVQFWKQSRHLIGVPTLWETARQRDSSFTCAQMFWWFNMYCGADWSVTPRPQYKADGRKIPDCYSHPADLRDWLQSELGPFPLFRFWGPLADITSSRWIAQATRLVFDKFQPTLTLCYLPHLDYPLQKLGPDHAEIPHHVRQIDDVAGDLIDPLRSRGVRVIVTSEYGIEAVDDSVHINRMLREAGLLAVRDERGGEHLDAGASRAFAVADHQVAHVYVRDVSPCDVAAICARIPGVEQVLDRKAQAAVGLDHPRSGELVLLAQPRRWFSYDYWLDDSRAPDFARTVDIHRKPGYDPCELFSTASPLAVAGKLLRRKLGFRTLLDVVPLDTKLVRGSHGRVTQAPEAQPVVITSRDSPVVSDTSDPSVPCSKLHDLVLDHLFTD